MPKLQQLLNAFSKNFIYIPECYAPCSDLSTLKSEIAFYCYTEGLDEFSGDESSFQARHYEVMHRSNLTISCTEQLSVKFENNKLIMLCTLAVIPKSHQN